MAQIGFTPIQIYHSSTAARVPLAADLIAGELALNIVDGKLYYKDNTGAVQLLTTAGTGGGTVTSITGSGGTTGLTLSGGPITSTGTLTIGGTLGHANGGTGQTSFTDGQLLIGNTLTGGLSKATLTAGANITITNANGAITIAAASSSGLVTAVTANFPATSTGGTAPVIGIAHGGGACTSSTGAGALVFNNSPSLITPALGTPASGNLVNCTGYTYANLSGSVPIWNQNTTGSSASCTGNAATASSPASGGSFITSSNIGSQSVNFASSAGTVSGTVANATNATNATNVAVQSNITQWPAYITSCLNNTSGTPQTIQQSGGLLYYRGDAGLYGQRHIGVFGGMVPGDDNLYSIGRPTNRYTIIYATTGTINTSDENSKQDIEELSAAENRVAVRIKSLIKKYRFKDAVAKKGGAARIHVGVIAQEVRDAFIAESLDANRYGMFCEDTWYELNGKSVNRAKTEQYNEDTPGAVKVTRLGVRYDELLAFVIAAL